MKTLKAANSKRTVLAAAAISLSLLAFPAFATAPTAHASVCAGAASCGHARALFATAALDDDGGSPNSVPSDLPDDSPPSPAAATGAVSVDSPASSPFPTFGLNLPTCGSSLIVPCMPMGGHGGVLVYSNNQFTMVYGPQPQLPINTPSWAVRGLNLPVSSFTPPAGSQTWAAQQTAPTAVGMSPQSVLWAMSGR